MCADNGAVENQMFHVWVIDKMLMHLFPNTIVTPASKAFVDTVPLAILLRQQSPLSTAPGDPQHALDKAAAVGFLPNVYAWAGTQVPENL
jgi:hypothetical protein